MQQYNESLLGLQWTIVFTTLLTYVPVILPGSRGYVFVNLFSQHSKPNYFASVARRAYAGSYKRDLINFHHFNIDEILVTVEAITISYCIDVRNKIYVELFTVLAFGNRELFTSPNIRSTKCSTEQRYSSSISHETTLLKICNRQKKQNLCVELKFSEPLPEAIQLIALLEQWKITISIRTKGSLLSCSVFQCVCDYFGECAPCDTCSLLLRDLVEYKTTSSLISAKRKTRDQN